MGKRTNTAQWIESQNRWRINVQKDGERKSFYSSKPGRTGQREANAKADAWLDDGVVGNKRVTELWDMYLESAKASSGTSNYLKIESIGRNYILPEIGHLKIDVITEGHLQRIIDKAYKNGTLLKDKPKNYKPMKEGDTLSRKTLNNILSTIRAFIKYCRVMLKVTALNPEAVSIPSGARYKGKDVLQPNALNTLFESTKSTKYRKDIFDNFIYAYRFIVSSGLRPGEAVALTYGSIKGDEVRVTGSINVLGENTSGKNENAIRGFFLQPLAKQAYFDQVALLKQQGIKLNINTPLFQIDTERQLYNAWQRYCRANDIPPISLYEMRHTFVSISKQLSEGKVRALVGHSRNMDTFGIYGHQLNGEAEQIAAEIGALFDQLLDNK